MVIAVALLAFPALAHAAFPGHNGKIAYSSNGVWTMNPDGTGATKLTASDPGHSPEWSPDGQRIAYLRTIPAPCPCGTQIRIINGDGTGDHLVYHAASPIQSSVAWSPDAQRLAFSSSGDLWTVGANGLGLVQLTQTPEAEVNPSWSPGGTEIAFSVSRGIDAVRPDGSARRTIVPPPPLPPPEEGQPDPGMGDPDWSPSGDFLVYTHFEGCDGLHTGKSLEIVRANGTGARLFIGGCYSHTNDPSWSPDGARIVFWGTGEGDVFPIEHASVDGSRPWVDTRVFGARPDWQPIPITGYPRPLATEPLKATLALAYEPCIAPNRTHGPPLDSPSCAPPAKSSSQLTVGTFDANGRNSNATAKVILSQIVGNPMTEADEADIGLRADVTDVRLASDLSDYTGALEARMTLRITDKDNTPSSGGPGAATVKDLPYSFSVACAVTPAEGVGSSCGVYTTADTLVPGTVKEKRRTVWDIGQVALHDGAGNAFMRQGLFVP